MMRRLRWRNPRVGVGPIPSGIHDPLGWARKTLHGQRLTGRYDLRCWADVGQFQPVCLRRLVGDRPGLDFGWMRFAPNEQGSRRGSPDRDRDAQCHQTKNGDPHRPRHARSQARHHGPASRRSMGTNHRDRIRAARWPANVRLQHRRTGVDRIGLRHRSPGSNCPLVKPPACRIVLRPISARSTSRSTTGSRLPRRCIPADRSAGANRPYSPR
jgi:hypothetical protein